MKRYFTLIAPGGLICLLYFIFQVIASAQDTPTPLPVQDKQEPYSPPVALPSNSVVPTDSVSLLDYYIDGGWMMHILLLCSVGTIAVICYCFTQISRKKLVPPKLVNNLTRHLDQRDVTHAYEVCQDNSSSFAQVLSSALLKVNFDRDKANKQAMMEAAGEGLDQAETRHMLWINYLNIFATLAPMIGLLGTVVGMIEAFQQLEQGRSEPDQLAGGIRQAMITTAGGLLVGIPAMFFYFFFRDRLMGLMSEIQKSSSFLIDVLCGEVKLSASALVTEKDQ